MALAAARSPRRPSLLWTASAVRAGKSTSRQLILRLRPRVTIWFHQPFGVVDESGGSLAVEREFASLIGLPLRRLQRFPGGATYWENAHLPGTTAFVVEFPPGAPGGSDRATSKPI